MKGRILVVDDDRALSEMLGIMLDKEGLETEFCETGEAALEMVRRGEPDLILLDVMLPGKDGVAVCEEIRSESDAPIVMLTAKTDTVDVVNGLEAGADDYIMKPFKSQELVARVRARLRRTDQNEPAHLEVGDLVIDVPGHEVQRRGKTIPLTPLEFQLLVALARKPWQVLTREELLEAVWGYHHPADNRLVNVHIQRLRSKLEDDPEHPTVVLTVRGVGYKVGQP